MRIREGDAENHWREVVRHPNGSDHIALLYHEESFLYEAVSDYIGAGLHEGQGVLMFATPARRSDTLRRLDAAGASASAAVQRGQLAMLDAAEVLDRICVDGRLDWSRFHEIAGGELAALRLQYPTVRAYGEIVDLLWQCGDIQAAHQLEGFWNELGKLYSFSLFCAYRIDPLDDRA